MFARIGLEISWKIQARFEEDANGKRKITLTRGQRDIFKTDTSYTHKELVKVLKDIRSNNFENTVEGKHSLSAEGVDRSSLP